MGLTMASLPIVLLGAMVGYLGADLLSGSVHWFCDSFFREDTPLIGRMVIWPFRDHHRHPAAITQYRLLEQDGTSYFILIPLLALAASGSPPPRVDAMTLAAHSALLGLAFGAFGTNLFHKWAHADDVAPLVGWLQRHRLILSPEAHRIHHRTYTGGYCVTSGWLNRVLDAVDFFGRTERLIRLAIRRPRTAEPLE
jgi:ubiquitin-conjugating enzyme E2 variant